MITCDEIIDVVETKRVTKNFKEKDAICKTKKFYISLAFLLITIALLIAVSIYCYLIKNWATYLLPYCNTSNKLKKLRINIMKNGE